MNHHQVNASWFHVRIACQYTVRRSTIRRAVKIIHRSCFPQFWIGLDFFHDSAVMSKNKNTLEKEDLAKRSIVEVLHLYCSAVDTCDADTFAALWADDAYVDFGERYQGNPSGFLALLVRDRNRIVSMAHQMEDIVINVSHERSSANSNSIVRAAVTRLSDHGEQRRLVRGHYNDRLVLTDGLRLIQQRVYRPIEETLLPT